VVTAIRINNSSTEKRNKEKREKERKKREKEEDAMSMASVHNDDQHGTVVHTEAGLVSLG
jgi:malic enzyme